MLSTVPDVTKEGIISPDALIKVQNCGSSHEALTKLYNFLKSVLHRADRNSNRNCSAYDAWSLLAEGEWEKGCEIGDHWSRFP